MVPLSAIQLGIPIAIFLIAGALVFLRSDLTRYHIPAIMLALFALTSGLMIPVGAEMIRSDAEKHDYRVESQVEGCDTPAAERVTEFSELSPAAQEVFLSALRSDEGYTTTVHPEEYEISTDTTQENYIVYESDCYSLVGFQRGTWGHGLLRMGLYVVGIPATIGVALLSVFSYRNESVRTPVAAVSGYVAAVGLYTVVGLRVLILISLLFAAVVWIALEDFEPQKSDSPELEER
jgi:hypothetical protein